MAEAMEQLRADATAEDHGVEVTLSTEGGSVGITVPPPGRWKSRANTMLREGNFDGWAEITLSDQDWASWADADPTNDDVEAFFAAWQAAAGETVGKSSRSRNGSRSMPRR
jgi:hypothetical protein